MNETEVLFSELKGHQGKVGVITLNRPAQLNALSHAMFEAISFKLQEWQQQDAIKAAIICGAGERAFCAGGDIRAIYYLREQLPSALDFFISEYLLNHCIYHWTKPYIALLNGLTMGGGAGVSLHGSYRVATEKFQFAMPETAIGFFPDIGGSYFLPRCTGKSGWYLGLTGATIGVTDAQFAGLIDMTTPSDQIPALFAAFTNATWDRDPHQTVQVILDKFANTINAPSILAQHHEVIDRCFSAATLEMVLSTLRQEHHSFATETLELLHCRSPTSLKVTFEELKRGEQLSFDECMRMEFRMTRRFLQMHDFFEGIRAQVIDKDRMPRWCPDQLEGVDEQMVTAYFMPLAPEEELPLAHKPL